MCLCRPVSQCVFADRAGIVPYGAACVYVAAFVCGTANYVLQHLLYYSIRLRCSICLCCSMCPYCSMCLCWAGVRVATFVCVAACICIQHLSVLQHCHYNSYQQLCCAAVKFGVAAVAVAAVVAPACDMVPCCHDAMLLPSLSLYLLPRLLLLMMI